MKKVVMIFVVVFIILSFLQLSYSDVQGGAEAVAFLEDSIGIGAVVEFTLPKILEEKLNLRTGLNYQGIGRTWLLNTYLLKYNLYDIPPTGLGIKNITGISFWGGAGLDFSIRNGSRESSDIEIKDKGSTWGNLSIGLDFELSDIVVPLEVGADYDMTSSEGLAIKIKTGILFKF